MSKQQPLFAYREIGEKFRLIESGMVPVIIARDEAVKETLAGLKGGWIPPGKAARDLQSFIVQVQPKARERLVKNGHVRFVDGFSQQFGVLETGSPYTRELGLLWEDTDYLGIEDMVI
ncbi:MAG TPA: hypothetical protein VEQ35_01075 [Beijerinckia sp.]|jgi:CRISPR-associated endonuclease/helicase Cas3|nr:hypothetical protein [Beijerinckia sp.]